jgi:hypothetical protein
MNDKIKELQERVEKLQAFKDYVHKRLDEAGVEKYPSGEHSEHGCRIGDRLDIVLNPKINKISIKIDSSPDKIKELKEKWNELLKSESFPFLPMTNGYETQVYTACTNKVEKEIVSNKPEFNISDRVYMDSPFGIYTGIVRSIVGDTITIASNSPSGNSSMLADYSIKSMEWKKFNKKNLNSHA